MPAESSSLQIRSSPDAFKHVQWSCGRSMRRYSPPFNFGLLHRSLGQTPKKICIKYVICRGMRPTLQDQSHHQSAHEIHMAHDESSCRRPSCESLALRVLQLKPGCETLDGLLHALPMDHWMHLARLETLRCSLQRKLLSL